MTFDNVKGLQQTLAQLEQVSSGMRNSASRKAVVAGARVVLKKAKSNVNSRSGTLRRGLVAAFSKKRSRKDVVAVALVRARAGLKYQPKTRVTRKGRTVTTRNADAYYAGFVEFGHLTVQRGGKIISGIARRRREAQETSKRVKPHPFLEPAYKTEGRAALDAIERSLRESLNRGGKG